MARVRLWRRGTRRYLPKLNHSRANPCPPLVRQWQLNAIPSRPSSISAALIQTFPAEIVSEIAADVLADTLFWEDTIRSWNYTFIAIDKVIKHPLLQVCKSWRNVIFQFALSSRQNRQGIYLAISTHQLAAIWQWYPDIELRGCLLLLGSPNDLFLGPTNDLDIISSLLAQGNAVNAVEAVEWLESSTTGFSYVGDPPDVNEALQRFCQAYADNSGSEEALEENVGLLCEAVIVLAHTACSKVLGLLSLLPCVETAEIPVWTIMVAGLTDTSLTPEQQEALMGALGQKVVTGDELRSQLQASIQQIQRMHIAGYSFGLFGIFPWLNSGTWLEEFVGLTGSVMEAGLRRRFLPTTTANMTRALPAGSLDHLKGLAWRDNSLDETVEYDHSALEMILRYPGHFQLEEFFAINKDNARKLVTPPIPFPYLAAPVFSHSLDTLRSVTLHLSFDTSELADEGQPIHHCALISEFSQRLPAIEYLDISTPAVCECALQGRFKPRKSRGTFKLTIVSEAWPFCAPRSVTFHAATWGAKPLLQLMKAAQLHFAEADGWGVQLHLAAPDNPSRVPEGPPRETLILLPQESQLIFSRLHIRTTCIRLRETAQGGRIQDTRDEWVERCRAISLSMLEGWVNDGHQSESWKAYPWGLEVEEDIFTPLDFDDEGV